MSYDHKRKTGLRVDKKAVEFKSTMASPAWIALFDRAAGGDRGAALELAESYLRGTYGEKNLIKAFKWASYAAKRQEPGAEDLLAEIKIARNSIDSSK